MFRHCLASLIAITCASAAWAEELRELTVAPGAEIVVSQPHNWQRDCSTRPMQIEPVEMPAQGQLIFTTANYKIGDFGAGNLVSGGDDVSCLG
ncbi:MAG: hypothetical protein OXC60_08315 [Litoreibacter sp.]|nr:hypothetical protein [Litoreibacter sp.]